ncbi:MAG: D-alanyl-D-alanine carboxypeptidase family protein [Clostridia bacterium]|nr:D-alanyl-D-alanine carboxypeptidase family protein [Clostridia bacterium]
MACFLRRMACALCVCVCLAGIMPSAKAEAPLEEGAPMTLTAPSAVLMEAETGAVIFEKNADERRPAASITKLMTLLLTLEKIDAGGISLEDKVTVSPAAAAQPGSQAFLDAGAAYPIKDLLKAVIISSANDGAAALAEYMAGTEESFVSLMNDRAEEMGLHNTHYRNCTGLPAEGQYTCARDVAVLSREITRHPVYFQYSSTWLDSLTHPSGRVTDLTNTNRLVRFYPDCDGLKTGSTSEAKYCLSATAQRNGMRLIAVVLGVPNSQTRFDEARAMMDYGFSAYSLTPVARKGDLIGMQVPVKMGARDSVDAALGSGLSLLLRSGQQNQLSFETSLPDCVTAPVKAGEPLGTVRVLLAGKRVAELPAVAAQDVRLPGLLEGFFRLWEHWR